MAFRITHNLPSWLGVRRAKHREHPSRVDNSPNERWCPENTPKDLSHLAEIAQFQPDNTSLVSLPASL